MSWLKRAIRPALLAACALVYIAFIIQFAHYHYRLGVVRSILADVQDLKVGTSTYAEAAAVANRHSDYVYPLSGCTTGDCEWKLILMNGACGGFVHNRSSNIPLECRLLLEFIRSQTLNSLGMRLSTVFVSFRAREGLVMTTEANVDAEGSDGDWPPMSWVFLPNEPEPWMSSRQTRLYDKDGYQGKRGWTELITPSMPDEQKRRILSTSWNCLDSLSGCFRLRDRLHGDESDPARVAWWSHRIRNGATPNVTITFIGILSIIIGSICLGASRLRGLSLEDRTFTVISLGIILIVLGIPAIYLTQVADDVSLWVWFAGAVMWIVLVRFGPRVPQSLLLRYLAYGLVAVFTGSLLGGIVALEDNAGVVIVSAVLILSVLVAQGVPARMPEKVVRGIVCVTAGVFSVSLYVLSRLQIIDLAEKPVAALKMPFQQWVPLPEWFDRFDLDIWLKVALITSFFLVGLLSATYFIIRGLHSRRHVQALEG